MIVILKSYFMEVSQSRTTQPSTVRRTIKGDGKHTVSSRTYGLVEFDKCGNYEYEIELGYTITVKNGKMTQLNDISFTNPYIFPKDGKSIMNGSQFIVKTHMRVLLQIIQ